jgi:hypothetical protein
VDLSTQEEDPELCCCASSISTSVEMSASVPRVLFFELSVVVIADVVDAAGFERASRILSRGSVGSSL